MFYLHLQSLQGDVGDRLLGKCIVSKSSDGQLYQWTGRRPVLWIKATRATVPTGEASDRTARKREVEVQKFTDAVCGGEAGSAAQRVHSTKVMSKEHRDLLLKEAGVLPQGAASGIGLAIKADLQLPWSKLRKLQRYMREFGVPMESEKAMRKQLAEGLPFPLTAHEVPLSDKEKDGNIVMCPCVCFPNVVDIVLHYINLNEEAGTLVWKDGIIPKEEIWVKVGGDHGGKSFKFCFQIANTMHPNALHNTIPFLVFAAKDTPGNLAATFGPYVEQLRELNGKTYKGKTIRVTLFGDYDFLTKSFGLSGASGKYPCLFCHCNKTEIQDSRTAVLATKRTLETLKSNHEDYVAHGSNIQSAKKYNNVIRPSLFPIEPKDVCIPVLHLDLGIYLWLYKSLLKETDEFDLRLAKLDVDIESSASFKVVCELQAKKNSTQAKVAYYKQQAEDIQQQVHWRIVQSQSMSPGTPEHVQAVGQINALHRNWTTVSNAVKGFDEEVKSIEAKLTKARVHQGPCSTSLEKVLQKHTVERQAYHSGSFVGNHVHKCLKGHVIEELTAAPLQMLKSTFLPESVPTALSYPQHVDLLLLDAEQMQARYSSLMKSYAICSRAFSQCTAVTEEQIKAFEAEVKTFMSLVRAEIRDRLNKPITPKLHMLECHTAPCMRRFGVPLGLLGEQGGESIHARFNNLRSACDNMPNKVDRLRVLETQYLTSTLPYYRKLIPQTRKRKRPDQ